MPHVLIKHFPSHISREDKEQIANQITEVITTGFSCPDNVVSISMQDIEPEQWNKEVYKPDIEDKQNILIKKPNY
jgi:4-oxalocrotonate tautomerase